MSKKLIIKRDGTEYCTRNGVPVTILMTRARSVEAEKWPHISKPVVALLKFPDEDFVLRYDKHGMFMVGFSGQKHPYDIIRRSDYIKMWNQLPLKGLV